MSPRLVLTNASPGLVYIPPRRFPARLYRPCHPWASKERTRRGSQVRLSSTAPAAKGPGRLACMRMLQSHTPGPKFGLISPPLNPASLRLHVDVSKGCEEGQFTCSLACTGGYCSANARRCVSASWQWLSVSPPTACPICLPIRLGWVPSEKARSILQSCLWKRLGMGWKWQYTSDLDRRPGSSPQPAASYPKA